MKIFSKGTWKSVLFGALLAAGCGTELELADAELAAKAVSVKASVRRGVLTVTGTPGADRIALRLSAAGKLDVDVGDDGSAQFSFDRSTFTQVAVDGAAGDDVVRMDESMGAFTVEEAVTVMGGDGDDTLTGGVGSETILGGRGNDTIDGYYGTDAIFMGEGDDTFVWSPGRNSDVIDGEAGADTVTFWGANIGEKLALTAEEGHLTFTRDVAAVGLDIDGVERMDLRTLGGTDTVSVGDLRGTDVAQVDVDLGGSIAGADGIADFVTVEGSPASETVVVTGEGTAVVARGVGAAVRVMNGEAVDRLIVNGAGGDFVDVNGSAAADEMMAFDDAGRPTVVVTGWNVLVAATGAAELAVNGLGGGDTLRGQGLLTTPLRLDGGDGNDTISGSAGIDTIEGGADSDTIDGGFAADHISLGAGDDVVVWNPGGSSDVVEGDEGTDTLSFNGANIGEAIDVGAVGDRLQVLRNIAVVDLDLGSLEQVNLRMLAGADTVAIHDLGGTPATRVAVDLGASDGIIDVVTVEGSAAADRFDVAQRGADLVVSGLAAEVRVTGGDPTTDRLVLAGGAGDEAHASGSEGPDTLTVFDDAGKPGLSFAAPNAVLNVTGFPRFTLNGLGGADHLAAFGASAIPLVLDGGEGEDVLTGGATADTLIGGPGADTLDGGFAADVVLMGPGDDTVVWSPGGGSDVLEGEDGNDTLSFNGANIAEIIELGANGSRLRLTRNIAAIVLDVAGVERVDVRALAGADSLIVNDLTGTAVTQVNLDVTASAGGGDASVDVVTVNGSPAPDAIALSAEGFTAVVSGLAATVRVKFPEPTDQLVVNGQGGADSIWADGIVQGLLTIIAQD